MIKKAIFFVIMVLIVISIFQLKSNSSNDIIVHLKILNKDTNESISEARITLIEIKKSFFYLKQEKYCFKDVSYTNSEGITSFILDNQKEHILWVERKENKNVIKYIDIKSNIKNHSLIVEKL